MCHQSNSLSHLFVNILYSKFGSSIGIIYLYIYLLCCGTNRLHYHTRLCKLLVKFITVLVFC